jgi:hypothetical protein
LEHHRGGMRTLVRVIVCALVLGLVVSPVAASLFTVSGLGTTGFLHSILFDIPEAISRWFGLERPIAAVLLLGWFIENLPVALVFAGIAALRYRSDSVSRSIAFDQAVTAFHAD